MIRIYDIKYDQYYPDAPVEIFLNLNKEEKENISQVIKNITGYFPKDYKIGSL